MVELDVLSARLAAPMAEGALRLEPFAEQHRADLKAACAEDHEIWEIYAANWGPGGFDANFDMTLAGRIGFVALDGDRVAGMSAFMALEADHAAVEIGGTYFRPDARGTGLNARVKRLMLDRAFASGIRRVSFRVDIRNARSQAAIAKLGAVRDGVMRADRITWTGHVRSTAVFSILRDEWA